MIKPRKTKKGKTRYGVRYDHHGKQDWLGTFESLNDARKALAQAQGSSERPMTCDEYVAFFLEGYRERVKQSSYDTAETALRGFAEEFKGIPLWKLDEMKMERWARENRWRVPMVVTLLNAAVKARLIDRNPATGLSKKGEGRKRLTPLTEKEVLALAQAAREIHGPMFRALVLFLAYTGVRPGEAFAMEWADVDLERNRILIQRRAYKGNIDLPKSNRARLIVLTPPAREAILAIKGEGLVFRAKRGGRLSQTSLAWYWQGITVKFGRKVQPYELRHFAGHHLYVRMNLPDRVVATQLGHSTPRLVQELYGHGDVGALEEIDAAFANVIPLRVKSQEK